MTKQEEIREGIAKMFWSIQLNQTGLMIAPADWDKVSLEGKAFLRGKAEEILSIPELVKGLELYSKFKDTVEPTLELLKGLEETAKSNLHLLEENPKRYRLEVVDREAELPENPWHQEFELVGKHLGWIPYSQAEDWAHRACSKAQQDMLKAGWVKEVKE